MKLKRMFMGLIMALIYLLTVCINVSAYGEISKKADLTISNLKELVAFRDSVNKGNTYEGKTVKLLKDIDMSSIDNWEPIGKNDKPFTGTFDGRNKTISNMTIVTTDDIFCTLPYGLFGQTYIIINNKWIGSTIKNLNIKNVKITVSSYSYAGAIVGAGAKTNIINCNAQGTIISSNDTSTGGIVGFGQYANINNCHSFVNIPSKGNRIGGIVGSGDYCTIKNSSVGAVNITGVNYIGGLIGCGNYINEISNCKSSANVSGEDMVGGLVGGVAYYSNINNSNSDGNVTGEGGIGGLVGWQDYGSKITNCYSTGNVNGIGGVGGLVGYSRNSSVFNCYSTGDVTGRSTVGGFAGEITSTDDIMKTGKLSSGNNIIQNCHSTGNVKSINGTYSEVNFGGFAGVIYYENVVNCYSIGNILGSIFSGGFGGYIADSNLINCYSTGNISYKTDPIHVYDCGGFIGFARDSKLYNCYSSGNTSSCGMRFGDYIGYWDEELTNQNCYYNSESVGRPYGKEQQEINIRNSYIENGAPTGMSFTSMKNQSFVSELNGPIPEGIAKMLKVNNVKVYKYNWKYGENNNLPFIDSTLPY